MNAKELGNQEASPIKRELRDISGYPVTVGAGAHCLTKRELFAAMVFQGMYSTYATGGSARDAVKAADALLAELAKDQP